MNEMISETAPPEGELLALPRRPETLDPADRIMALEAALLLLLELMIARDVLSRGDLAKLLDGFEGDTLAGMADLLQGAEPRDKLRAQGIATAIRHVCGTLRRAL